MAVTKRDSKAELLEEVHKAYKQAEYYKEKANTREKIYYKLDLLNDNLYAWVSILSTTTIISIIWVLVLFFK